MGGKWASLETDDILANFIQDTTSWQEPRTLANLPAFLENFSKEPDNLAKAPKQKGSPHTIIVAGSGLRAADVVRAVRKYQSKENAVAKLVCDPFSKTPSKPPLTVVQSLPSISKLTSPSNSSRRTGRE